MTGPDLVTCLFEVGAAAAQLLNVRALLRDRTVRGISLTSTAFFNVWGLWNLYYYLHLGQWMAWSGGLLLTFINLVWLGLALRFSREGRQTQVWPKAGQTVRPKDGQTGAT